MCFTSTWCCSDSQNCRRPNKRLDVKQHTTAYTRQTKIENFLQKRFVTLNANKTRFADKEIYCITYVINSTDIKVIAFNTAKSSDYMIYVGVMHVRILKRYS